MNEFEQKQQPTTPGIKGIEGATPKNADKPDYFFETLPEDDDATVPYEVPKKPVDPKQKEGVETHDWLRDTEERHIKASSMAAKTN